MILKMWVKVRENGCGEVAAHFAQPHPQRKSKAEEAERLEAVIHATRHGLI
jgi:hypothetical protein